MFARIQNALHRRFARWFGRRMCNLQLEHPIVSFTFDDFPKSALSNGGSILRNHGFTGTYYASFGLMDKDTPTGQIFDRDDLDNLVADGHELACHTFDHCDSWQTAPAEFEASIQRNLQYLASQFPDLLMQNLSYPISYPRPETKTRVARHYSSARGGGQTYNNGPTDLNYLKAFFIEQSRENISAIEDIIEANAQAVGWLVFATHDVTESPTRFGCSPRLFERLVKSADRSGARILPVATAVSLATGNPIALNHNLNPNPNHSSEAALGRRSPTEISTRI